ncbi:hypothetical protein FNH22_19260 [Fulvivirga sp. M361]|uniref:M43 family zinc metalloprotease n=1 Tax=Fulvivirga sp. M361 TaxID=2594266 RepID=UPI00117A0EE5|nr:M43 family zinc metalloprotease [Fulvivirga sp. M361]TRX54894.1 hypothetical protein FNH22_19260 [Fulvivirga sp. M361]
MKRIKISALISLVVIQCISAQSVDQRQDCLVKDPGDFEFFESWLQSKSVQRGYSITSDVIYRIPVVVHVLHMGDPMGEGFNFSEEQIHSQIEVMNQDFRKKEGTSGYNEHPDGADAGIEFILAKTSPDGEPTNGIVRIDMTTSDHLNLSGDLLAVGWSFNVWDPHEYLNVYSVPSIPDFGLGYARFPITDLIPLPDGQEELIIPGFETVHGVAVRDLDGIAINANHFGRVDLESSYNLGRTGTHEAGHFLGLYHTWGPAKFEGTCNGDDFCEDTPPTSDLTTGCPANKLACDGSKAMIENYMDYSDDACMNIFTRDQVKRMRTVLENSPRRKSLLTSKGLFPPDPVLNIPEPIVQQTSVYPNPFEDQLFIHMPEKAGLTENIELYDLSGYYLGKVSLKPVGNQTYHTTRLPGQLPKTIIIKVPVENKAEWHRVIRK